MPSLEQEGTPERVPFSYAVIRVVPRVEREEFVVHVTRNGHHTRKRQ